MLLIPTFQYSGLSDNLLLVCHVLEVVSCPPHNVSHSFPCSYLCFLTSRHQLWYLQQLSFKHSNLLLHPPHSFLPCYCALTLEILQLYCNLQSTDSSSFSQDLAPSIWYMSLFWLQDCTLRCELLLSFLCSFLSSPQSLIIAISESSPLSLFFSILVSLISSGF